MNLRRLVGDFIRKRNPLDIQHITVPISVFPIAASFRIAHVSDIHIPRCAFSPREIADAVKNQNPDVIFLTGDVMDGRSKFDAPKISLLISLLIKIAPVYAISGNHERNNHKYYKIWKTMLELRGIQFMDDKFTRFEKGDVTFVIAGIRDMNISGAQEFDCSFLTEIEITDNECYLLLHHKPNIWRSYYPDDAPLPDIIFSGHAHGGQVRIPFINRGLIAPNQGLFPKYTSGMYRYFDGSQEIVSRGLASSTKPVRINNKPHIPIVDLIPKS